MVPALLACGGAGDEPRLEGGADDASVGARDTASRTTVAVAGRILDVELALDPESRMRGLSGRSDVGEGGMLFVLPRPRHFALVMRDCRHPLDAVFLDGAARVVSVHEMKVEPPRQRGEASRDYERRLPVYRSAGPVRFALELAGGRIAELGLAPGQPVVIDGLEDVLRRVR